MTIELSASYKIVLAYSLDLLTGDPHWLPHPVKGIGKIIYWLEGYVRRYISHLKIGGIILAGLVIMATYFSTWLIVWAAEAINEVLGAIVSILLIYTTFAARGLHQEAIKVYYALSSDNLDLARFQVSHIVSRDTKNLDYHGIIKAGVESVAENTVDGIVSPLFFAFLGGPAAAMAYKAVNTLDSMLGYKTDEYRDIGWASAKIDDLSNLVPARIARCLFPIAAWLIGKNGWQALRIGFRDGRKHPSPNSGIPEACVAGALGIQLGGFNYYQGQMYLKPFIGDQRRELHPEQIKQAISLMYGVSFLMLILGWLVTLGWKAIFP